MLTYLTYITILFNLGIHFFHKAFKKPIFLAVKASTNCILLSKLSKPSKRQMYPHFLQERTFPETKLDIKSSQFSFGRNNELQLLSKHIRKKILRKEKNGGAFLGLVVRNITYKLSFKDCIKFRPSADILLHLPKQLSSLFSLV